MTWVAVQPRLRHTAFAGLSALFTAVGAASLDGGLLGGSHRCLSKSARLSLGLFAGKLLILSEKAGRLAYPISSIQGDGVD